MKSIHEVMNKLFERTKFIFEYIGLNTSIAIVLAIALICAATSLLPLNGVLWKMSRLFVMSVFFSLIIVYGYLRDYRYQKYRKGMRYKTVLWNLVVVKSLMFVPIAEWIFFVILECVGYHRRFDFWDGFCITWIIWCLILWIDRKIARKDRFSKDQKTPSPFYDKK